MLVFKKNYSYGGWKDCIYLSNDSIDLVATTEVGPRIIRFGFGGQKNLFREFENDAGKVGGDEYRLYGGCRLWHAPEERTRTYYPDNETVEYQWDGISLKLLQKVEKTTGLQKEIIIDMDPGKDKVTLTYHIYNRNLWKVKYAPWAICMMGLGGRAIVPQEPFKSWEESLAPSRSLVLWGYSTMNDPRWIWGEKYIQLRQDRDAKTRQTVGIRNKQGWLAYSLGDYIFIKRYRFYPRAEYVEFGVNTDIYTDQDALEVETRGKYEEVSPGDFTEHKENWYIFESKIEEDESHIESTILPLIKMTEIP
jgi:hypothetical protein